MNLQSFAQELYVLDKISPAPQLPAKDGEILEVSDENNGLFSFEPLEVQEPVEIEIVVEELPGAPAGTKDPEPVLEVLDEDTHTQEKDDNDAKKSKNDKWNWSQHGSHGFVAWIKSRLDDVPKHDGISAGGLERAISYLEKLDAEISKAMRLDLDGELDADKIEEIRAQLDDGLSRLQARLDKVKKAKKSSRKKRAEYTVDNEGFIKEAQKITGVSGVYVAVPLLISGIARVCVNGAVSAGHDVNVIYNDQCDKYKLNDRERSEVRWLLWDMGLPLRGDRGFMPDEVYEQSSSDNYDFMANYSA